MSETGKRHWRTRALFGAGVVALSAVGGCVSGVTSGNMDDIAGAPAQNPGNGGSGAGGAAVAPAVVDPGRVGIHRLNNTEYDYTVRDLLGTTLQPAVPFLAEDGLNFDNTASALGMTPAQYQGYFQAAADLSAEVLANPAERARLLSCTPTVAGDACARQIITNFGAKVYRRPLEVAEIDRAMRVYDADFARAKSGPDALGQALRAMLSAANFLYRVEYDAVPTSTAPHALSGYEVASRLSYLAWSSMPDDALFDAAKAGQLSDPVALEATVDRLLADGKAAGFVESFAGQWLSIRRLSDHSVTAQVFPTYTPALGDAMAAEGYLWFQEFLATDRPLSDWFSADFNYVNDVLAQHYGMPAPGTGAQMKRVEVTTDKRVGFLGLASFLTQTSFPSRTSPTKRGEWALTELLCSPPPPPPAVIPKLEESADPSEANQAAGAENVRARLEKHRSNPACAACHSTLDPIGLGLERYDGIGRYREAYANGDAIAPNGELPGGLPFAGPEELGALLAKDPRFTACAASKLYTYALGREIDAIDAAPMQQLNSKWAARGLTLRNLMKEVVRSDAFRFRHGEPE